MSSVAVWHRADLRTADNAALAAATGARSLAGTVVPVFVVDPRYYGEDGLACDARLRFLHECLLDLDRQYEDLGSSLVLLRGDPRERLHELLDGPVDAIHYNRHPTGRHGERVAETVRGWPETTAHADDGLRYADQRHRDGTVAVDTREGWDEHAEAYFRREPQPRPERLPSNPVESETSVKAVEAEFGVDPDKRSVPEGGTLAGNARLSAFLDDVQAYPQKVAPPAAAEEGTSRLSPYLAFGALSARQVYRSLLDAPDCRGREMLVSRLYWNRHYHQKLADWPGWTDRSVNPVFRDLFRERHDPDLDRAWRAGETGFPLVDAAMRALRETGFINFRLRALVASVYVYVLKQWWRRGADYMYEQLIDADAAINYTQWQSQCNLTGVHPVRVYDPAKQVREYDPDGEYIRRYVPELADLPDEHLPRPARTPEPVQQSCGVDIGTDYPYPVVEFDHEADRARELYAGLASRAKEAVRPGSRAWRRTSLSGQRRDRLEEDAEADGQTRLDEF